ncbi:MAG: response regulator [Nitrospinota bacterium]
MALALVIEDSNFQRKIIIKFLKAEGYEIIEAPNGKVGLEKAAEHKPEIIFTDLVMPELDGFAVLKTLQEQGSKIPVVVLTSDIQAPVREQCLGLGANVFLNKPFNQNQMKQALEEIWGPSGRPS